MYETQKLEDAQYCVLTAAKLIAPHIEDSFSAGKSQAGIAKLFVLSIISVVGYDYCVNAMKNSEYAGLAGELEISKAVMYLKQRQLPAAIETLKSLDKESATAVNAATNLCFIYFLVRIDEESTAESNLFVVKARGLSECVKIR